MAWIVAFALVQDPAEVYRHYCAHCHGDDARGSGRLWSAELPVRPADLTKSRLDLASMERAIREGSPSRYCPPWERTIPRADVRRLARHLRGEEPAPRSPSEPKAPFPWFWAAFVFAEAVALALILRRDPSGNSGSNG